MSNVEQLENQLSEVIATLIEAKTAELKEELYNGDDEVDEGEVEDCADEARNYVAEFIDEEFETL